MAKKEFKGIPLKTYLYLIEEAVITQVVMYVKGYHSARRERGDGVDQFKIYLYDKAQGYIKLEELLNLGKSIREYLKIFKEPLIDEKRTKIYEWENKEGIRFRVVVNTLKGEGLMINPLPEFDDITISFYSDRNLNERMQFKNAEVAKFYTQTIPILTSSHNTDVSQTSKLDIEGIDKKKSKKRQRSR